MLATADTFVFGEFRLDRRGEGLSRRDERGIFIPVSIGLRSLGETERGVKELAETYRLSGKVWVSTIADMKVTGYWGPPKIRELYESVYFAGLRKLGVPEE